MIRDNEWGAGVEKICSVLGISRSGYYNWLKPKPESESELKGTIKNIFQKSKGTYGSPRIHLELKEQKIKASKSTVARTMNKLGLVARPKKKFVRTTDSEHNNPISDNLLKQDFCADRINHKWVSDITYIATKNGHCFLTTIMDLADRMIVSWNVSTSLDAEQTVINAMKKALEKNKIKEELIFHSDQGIQYSCFDFRKLINSNKHIKQSMSRKGNCWDNAVAESFFKTLKSECIKNKIFENDYEVHKTIFDYIERWYNTQRKHSSIGNMSPLQKNRLLLNRLAV